MTDANREGLFGRLALEGMVIVASILLAFALDTWWDGRSERAEEAAVLENLRREFAAADVQFEFYYGWHERITAAIGSTLEAARAARAEGIDHVVVPDTALALTYLAPTFDPRLGTLDGLRASGRLKLIQDPELRHALAGWNGLLREGTEEEVKAQRHVADQLDPVLRRRMDVSRPIGLILPLTDGTITTEQTRWTSALPVDSEVLGVLAMRHIHELHGLDDLGDVHEELERILARIESLLPG